MSVEIVSDSCEPALAPGPSLAYVDSEYGLNVPAPGAARIWGRQALPPGLSMSGKTAVDGCEGDIHSVAVWGSTSRGGERFELTFEHAWEGVEGCGDDLSIPHSSCERSVRTGFRLEERCEAPCEVTPTGWPDAEPPYGCRCP